MKKKLKLLTVSALFLFTFSCNRDENIKIEESVSAKTENTSMMAKQYNNIGNPYEYVGESHNLFLESWSSQSPTDLSNIVNLSIDFSNQINNNINILDYVSHDEILNSVNTSLNQPFTTQIEQSHNEGKISDVVYQQLLRLSKILSNVSEEEGVDVLVTKIQDLEESILLLHLNETDKPILLSVISVAKYSSNYWREVYYEPQTASKIKLPNWAKNILNLGYVVSADTAGALAGAELGRWISDFTGVESKSIVPVITVACAGAASTYAASHPVFN